MKELNIAGVQITLDGFKEIHNKGRGHRALPSDREKPGGGKRKNLPVTFLHRACS